MKFVSDKENDRDERVLYPTAGAQPSIFDTHDEDVDKFHDSNLLIEGLHQGNN